MELQRRYTRLNDGSSQAPRLEIHHSWWAMRGVGDARGEWSMEEKIERIAEAGYTGILGRLPAPEDADNWRKLLDRYQLQFAMEAFPAERGAFAAWLKDAKAFGVSYVNAQVQDAFVTGADAIERLSGLIEEAAVANVPLFIETHRGRITQDLLRTVEYVKALPDMRLTIDLSHYVLAGEMLLPNDTAERFFDILLERTSCIHGRISNGEQIQVDIGPNAEHPLVERYTGWWLKGMKRWRADARAGDILPFVSELGPIPYAIADKGYMQPPQGEISNRWEQGLLMKRLAQEAWENAK